MDIFCTFSTHCFSKNYYRNFFFLKDKQLVGMHIYTNMLEYYGDMFSPFWFKATVLKKKMYYNMRVKTVKRNLAEIVSKMEIYKSRLLEFPHERLRNLMNCIKEVSLLEGFVSNILCWQQLVPENSMKSVLMASSHASLYCIYHAVFLYYFKEEKIPRGCVAIIYEAFKKKR